MIEPVIIGNQGEADMDGGPFRGSRPTDTRRTVTRQEPVQQRQPEQPQITTEEPKTVHRTVTPHHTTKQDKSKKRFVIPIIALLVAIIVIAGGLFAWSKMQATATAIDGGKYQAVFFTNGQVYFGKLASFNSEYMKLTDIYYLQSQQSGEATDSKNPQETSTDQSDVQLIKLGDEIHGPEDEMIVSKNQMLFYENLKSDGKVAKSIDQYKQTK